MTDQDHGQVSVQLRPRITQQSDRPARKRNFTPARRKSNTSLSLSKHQNSQMAMPSSSGPQLRQSRRRSSAHTSDHVGAHDMSAHSSRPGTGFTKTGRISKALKGVKVHECDQCGKVYSRAEHLRRHQNNHRTSPIRCHVCDRPFFRDDLLARHVAKSHHPNGLQAVLLEGEGPSRRLSVISQPSSTISDATTSHSVKVEPEHYTTSSQLSTPASFATTYPNSVRNPIHHIVPPFQPPNWQDSRFATEGHLYVPTPTAIPPPWLSPYHQPPTLDDFGFVEWSNISSLQSPASNSPPFLDRQLIADLEMRGFHASSRSSPAPVTAVPPSLMPVSSNSLDESSQDAQLELNFSKERKQTYFKAYWQHFHPIFPILHKGRWPYKGMQGGKLLLFAMMAIGAFYTQEVFAATDSLILLERSQVMILNLNLTPATMTLEVQQAIVLLEFLSQFKAKRAPDGLSKMFCDVYDRLWAIHSEHHLRSTVEKLGEVLRQPDESLGRQWLQWIELHSRERLLAACYILDSRHSLLLARQSCSAASSGLELYIPVPNAVWEALTHQQWAQKLRTSNTQTASVYDLLSRIEQGSTMVYDPFPSALLVACHSASTIPCRPNDMSMAFPGSYHSIFDSSRIHLLSRALSPHFSVRIMSQVLQLIALVPFRALIATSGESWFFSKRLAGDARTAAEEFDQLKYQMRSWTTSRVPQPTSYEPMQSQLDPSFLPSILIALQILNEASSVQSPHLELAFGPELALYFASLVLWAATYAALSQPGRQSPLLIEADADPFEWEFPRSAELMKEFIKIATTDVKQAMAASTSSSPIPQQSQLVPTSSPLPNPAMHGLIPPVPLPLASSPSYPQTALSASVSPTLSTIPTTAVLPPNPVLFPPPKMLRSWRIGAGTVLRWSASVLGGAGHRNSAAGELIEGAISVLEKLGRSGWAGPWF